MSKFDFSGWATRNDVRCSDGRTILKDAFKHNDGQTVPLVWNHQHNDPLNVLGHALLENREEGVYAYCTFNETENGQQAKLLVEHGDIKQLSIYANQLRQEKGNVLHGSIREVSLVLAGANPKAYIESIVRHSDDGEAVVSDEEGVIYTGEDFTLCHADEQKKDSKTDDEEPDEVNKDKTVKEVIDTMNKEQKLVMYGLIEQAIKNATNENEEKENNNSEGGDSTMKQNVFENDTQENTLAHVDMGAIFTDAKRYGSLKESFFAHAGDTEHAQVTQDYGINGTDFLFPEAHTLNTPPAFIQRDMGWVAKVMKAVHHTPFSRIKSLFADITEDDARAKGYMQKGKLKKEEVFGLLKRTTTPTTVYKKQKLDRDDVIDITDFDVVAWIKAEMRMMLDEEIARAVLIGDGRSISSDDKINEQNIRPILTDEDLYTIKATVNVAADATADQKAKEFIRTVVKARKNYKGSGEPTLYTTEDVLTDCLLIEDNNGRVIYDSVAKLANALRVKEIVTVPVMEGVKGKNGGDLLGIVVNLNDYNVGADKGGAVNMFDDFDIDYNAQKYLIETRCSGALIKPYAAIAVEAATAAEG